MSRAEALGGGWFTDELDGIGALLPTHKTVDGDQTTARFFASWFFSLETYSRTLTVNPPSGYAAYPVLTAAIAAGESSLFTYVSPAGVTLDQMSVPTAYTANGGGTITWALSSGNITGAIASYTGSGNSLLTAYIWRQLTRTWSTIALVMQNGVIVDAFDAVSTKVDHLHTVGNVSFSIDAVDLTVASVAHTHAVAASALVQTNSLTPAKVDHLHTVGNTTIAVHVTYTHAVTLNPPSGYIALPIAAASASSATSSAFYSPGFTPADGDQCAPPTTYDDSGTPATLTWATSSGNMTGLVASHTGSGNVTALTIPYWRASTQTWTSFDVHLVGGTIVQGNTLPVADVAHVHALSATSYLYQRMVLSRAMTLNPPSGFTAFPVLAASALLTSNSFFSLLGFSPADGDQAMVPNTWNDSGTPRAITWGVDAFGNITGRITALAGTGPTTVSVAYRRESTGTWSSVSFVLQNPVTLTVAGVFHTHAAANVVVDQLNVLPVQKLDHVHALANAQVANPGTPVTYSRAMTLIPPTGRLALPIAAGSALKTSDSVFQYLTGVPTTGDQASPPTTYSDGGVPTAITWETDGSGNMTGRISQIDGSGQTVITVPYWAHETATWYVLTINLVDFAGSLSVASVAHAHSLSGSNVLQLGAILPAKIDHVHILFSTAVAASYTVLPQDVVHVHSLSIAGVATQGNIGVFGLTHLHTLGDATLVQQNNLLPAGVVHTHNVTAAAIGINVTLEPDNIAHGHVVSAAFLQQTTLLSPADLSHVMFLEGATTSMIDSLNIHRVDHRHFLQSPLVEVLVPGPISGNFVLYPILTAKISFTPR